MASVATPEPVAPTAQNARKTRKRAPKACLSCRARKVRCDVSQRGRPCMNCYLDNETCVVTSRASRFRRAGREGKEDAQLSHPPYHTENHSHGSPMDDSIDVGIDDERILPQAEFVQVANETHTAENEHTAHISSLLGCTQEDIPRDQQSYMESNGYPDSLFTQPPNATSSFNNNPSIPMQVFDPLGNSEIPCWTNEQPVAVNADITYSYYPFLAINNLHNVIPQDVNFLDSQGCFRIPTREILDEFMQQYFLHVHPLMPLINEGDFWSLYDCQDNGTTGEKMSLLVFQAMMFSCCNFVSKGSIKALGFPNIRSARATLYRRTKLLFDFDTESSLVCLAQAALLLTYWSPNWSLATKKPNTAWLGVAIQNAKSAEAHMYSAMPTFSPIVDPVEHKKQNSLKRLWWCCVFRDRLISLGMRRSIQVSRAHFDLDSNSGLGFSDLSDEISRSKVYDSETKRRLIEIFVQLGELCQILTDLLTLVFPLDDVPGWGRHNGAEGARKARMCKAALRRWYKAATLRFPVFGGGGASSKTARDKYVQHDSVILYTNLIYMFYHSARAALCHHEVLQIAMASTSPNANNPPGGFSNIYESRNELQDAASGVTECLNELIQRRLARWLPISAISCTAMPLVLHVIDVKLLSRKKQSGATPDEKRRMALKQQRLNILIEAMKTYQPQYGGVDYISETIRHIVNLAQIDPPCNAPSDTTSSVVSAFPQEPENGTQPVISDWTDILASHPGSYLRLSLTMDISMSKGRLARETDFPVKLRGLFAHGISPIRVLLAGGHPGATQTAPPPPFSSTPAVAVASQMYPNDPVAHIQPGSVHSLSSSDSDSASPDPADEPATGASLDTDSSPDERGQTSLESLISEPLLPGTDAADVTRDTPMDMFVNIYAGGEETDWLRHTWDEEIDTNDKETARALLNALTEG